MYVHLYLQNTVFSNDINLKTGPTYNLYLISIGSTYAHFTVYYVPNGRRDTWWYSGNPLASHL